MIFSKEISTHKRNKCAAGGENVHYKLTSNVLGMLHNGLHLTMRNIDKSQDKTAIMFKIYHVDSICKFNLKN